jgi:hypothetical protein
MNDEEKVDYQKPTEEAEALEQQQWDEMNEWVRRQWADAVSKEVTDLADQLHTLTEDRTFINKFISKIVKGTGG